MNNATDNEYGLICPVRGCRKKNNRRFRRVIGLVMHMVEMHGEEEVIKRLRAKWG